MTSRLEKACRTWHQSSEAESQRESGSKERAAERCSRSTRSFGRVRSTVLEKLAPQLVAANILTALHLESFAILCETYEEYRILSTWLREDPSRATVIAASGYVSESPQVRMRDRANANLQKLWLKFGLTPMALAQMRKHGGVGGKTVPKIKAFAASGMMRAGMKARGSNKLLALRAKAKREGWHKWIRQGDGEAADERAMLNGCWVESRRIDHWLEFVDEYGTLTEGAFAGKKFDLLDWQATDTSRLFGWVKHSKEWNQIVRRFRFWYEEVPKKNGKTPLLSLIGNYLMFADADERQINCYLAATTRKQGRAMLGPCDTADQESSGHDGDGKHQKAEGFYSVQYEENLWTVVAADPESADASTVTALPTSCTDGKVTSFLTHSSGCSHHNLKDCLQRSQPQMTQLASAIIA